MIKGSAASVTVTLAPRDPLVLRDGRPFGTSDRARCLDWPYPSVMAGALRTIIAKAKSAGGKDPFESREFLSQVKAIRISGPLPLVDGGLLLPRPLDVLLFKTPARDEVVPLRPVPLAPGEGCDVPYPGLWPVEVSRDDKPTSLPAFLPIESVASWLSRNPCDHLDRSGGIGPFAKDVRMHVSIDPITGTVKEEELFVTEGLALPDVPMPPHQSAVLDRKAQPCVRIAARLETCDPGIYSVARSLDVLSPVGGERRLARVQSADLPGIWHCPGLVANALTSARGVRMLLATAAVFAGGWLPGWISPTTLEGCPPGTAVALRLKGACVDRWKPVSGWSLERGSRGPKPIRRCVPAGSVYFFEVLSQDTSPLRDLWLKSVCDGEQDRDDGFGIAAWGVWDVGYDT